MKNLIVRRNLNRLNNKTRIEDLKKDLIALKSINRLRRINNLLDTTDNPKTLNYCTNLYVLTRNNK